jgi:BirA family biotin operon repressor/biotin-[acetyl-CoA-carboxylase] ligase
MYRDSAALAQALRRHLKGRVVGGKVLAYDSLPSTMDRAREAAREGAPEGTVVIAGEQTAGRGRQGRSWLSPRGGLALSVIFRPDLRHLPGMVMISALSVKRTIRETTGLAAGIKWPNDILLNGRKVCGILVENELRAGGVSFSVAGIGLNVAVDTQAHPEIAAIATSLEKEAGRAVGLGEVAGELLEQLDILYSDLRAGRSIFEEWRDSLVTLGHRVRIEHGASPEEGLAEGVTPEGALLVRRADGTQATVLAGDAVIPA